MFFSIIETIATRIGTALGTALAGYGIAQDDISVLVAAVPILLGLLVDVVTKGTIKNRLFKRGE